MGSVERLLAALGALSLPPDEAENEGVGPLLYAASGSSALKKAYYQSAARSVVLEDALDEVKGAFAERGVVPVLLKGADFARSLYPSPALRPMGDLDLWVAREEGDLAEDALAKLGYRPALPEMRPGLARAIRHARLYVGGGQKDVGVDLHWSLVGHDSDRRAPSLDWFRSRSAGARLSATAALLYLAAHMKLQHYDERARSIWLCDFYLLSQRPEVDWPELLGAARRFGWETALAATAAETSERLGLTLPEPLADHARAVTMAVPRRKGGPERAWNELSTLPLRGRAALLRAYLLPSPSYVRFRYRPRPAWAWPLFYFVRWARLATGSLSMAVKARRARPLLGDVPL
jgi:hypothetical protein